MVRNISRRKNAKRSRKLRCQSADSGVDTSLNDTAFQRVESSKNQIHGLEEDRLDFEPELSDDELAGSCGKRSHYINSDQSTVKIGGSNRGNSSYSTGDSESISTVSVGHGRDMLPVPKIDAEDGRQNEYLPFVYTASIDTKTLLDSSSEEISSDSDGNGNNRFSTEDDGSRSQNSTGDFDNFIEDSEYNISAEEENRLLGSSDEQSDDTQPRISQPIISKSSVETCLIGSARITLPRFINTIHEKRRRSDNDLKRLKPIREHKKLRKKKKWELRFVPEYVPMRVFLNDVGYVPPFSSSEEEESETGSTSSAPQVKKLYVICNEKAKIVCEKPVPEMPRSVATFHKADDATFKLPLPPPKRPPTRPKKTVSNNDRSDTNLQIKIVNRQALVGQKHANNEDTNRSTPRSSEKEYDIDQDDSISIIASTIVDINEDTLDVGTGLDELDEFGIGDISDLSLEEMERNQPEALEDIDNPSQRRVEDWIKSVSKPEVPGGISSMAPELDSKVQLVSSKGDLNAVPPANPSGNPRIHFKDIPFMFSGLCYFHYFNGKCLRPNYCCQLHSITTNKFVKRFEKCSTEELLRGYQIALRFENFFREIYPSFIIAFGSLKMHNELIKSIKDILRISGINRAEALDLVVKAFVDSGLSFLDTIEKISFNVGFLEYPVLADNLLDLITRKPNIAENWEVINRIAKARGHLSPEIVRRILNRVVSVYPVNKNLALEIYNVVIKNKMTDIAQISDSLLAPFRAIVGFRELAETTPKPIVPLSPPGPFNQPMGTANEREVLSARIDHNLTKARERFEREVEGHTVKTTVVRNSPTIPVDACYFRSYDYGAAKVSRPYDVYGQSSDADDRYITPVRREDIFFQHDSPSRNVGNHQFVGDGMFSASGSCSSHGSIHSPNSSLHFEPPEVGEYVPETIRRKDARVDHNMSENYIPLSFVPPPVSVIQRQDSVSTLTPSMPLFGNPRYRNDFDFDKSLHNLLPDSLEHVSINERDVAKLDHAIKTKNGAEFYRLLEFYKSPPTLRAFITMTIAHLKSCENGLYELLIDLIESLEVVKPDYARDIHIKAIFEVVIMNLLFAFEKKGQWDQAKKVLERFCDWDSLISSQIFPKRRPSHMGRYIFLAKIFANGKNFHFVYEILQCVSLRLLESPESWPYQNDPQVDMKSRNAVLNDFFQHGYRYNIAGVADMYRNIIKYGGIRGYDNPLFHFNPMLVAIMNSQQTSFLRYFYSDINLFSKEMDRNVLRAFTILLADQLSQNNLLELYDICCGRQIYTYYMGSETTIILRTNMLDTELQLILNYYFEKVSRTRRVPAGDVNVVIKLFDSKVLYPKMLQKCVRSIQEINEKVKEILGNSLGIYIKDAPSSKPTIVEIKRTLIEDWLQQNTRWGRV